MMKRDNPGFTLVELMVVVVILAILAVVAVASYKYYIRRARLEEGKGLLQEIKMKQETYFSTYSQYVDTGSGESDLYPDTNAPNDNTRWDWGGLDCTNPSGVVQRGWCDLGFKPSNSTYFRLVTIGWNRKKGTSAPSSAYGFVNGMDFSKRWFYAIARADFDADGTMSAFIVTSQSNAIVSFDELE